MLYNSPEILVFSIDVAFDHMKYILLVCEKKSWLLQFVHFGDLCVQ